MEDKIEVYQLAKQKGLLKKKSGYFADVNKQNKTDEKLPIKLTGLTVELIKSIYQTQNCKSGGTKNDKRTL
ncbi:MAG: hypothetical protein V1773_07660 [bacterium]